jgi:ABC-type spermidine/putrescine transport system permease subunit II
MSTAFSKRQKAGQRLVNVAAGAALLYIFIPIFVIVLFSFNEPKGKYNIKWQNFTLDNWANPFVEKELTSALWVSLRIALIATIVSTILGTLIAMSLSRYKFKASGAVNLFLVLPLTAPEIVLGSSTAASILATPPSSLRTSCFKSPLWRSRFAHVFAVSTGPSSKQRKTLEQLRREHFGK